MQISGTRRRSSFSLLFVLIASLIAGCGGHATGTTGQGTAITVTATGTIHAGQTLQLYATQGGKDVNTTATWKSSNPSVATVSATGLVTGLAAGTTTITATVGSAVGSLTLTIGAPVISRVTITPASATVLTGSTLQFTATATNSDGSNTNVTTLVTWAVTPASVATINAAGLLQSISAGSFTATATSGPVIGNVSGTVSNKVLTSIAVTPATIAISSGNSQQFTATGTYNDQTQQDLTGMVTWTSSNTTALSISASGLAVAAPVTSATPVSVTASTSVLTASASVTVNKAARLSSLEVEPTSASIAPETAQQQTATAHYSDGSEQDVTNQVKWSVTASPLLGGHTRPTAHAAAGPRADSTGSVTVAQNGISTATAPGAANVQATLGLVSGQAVLLVRNTTIKSLAINLPDSSIPVGATQRLTLKGVFNDGSSQDLSLTANWQSVDPGIATIDSHGVVTAVSAGDVEFTAGFGGQAARSGMVQVLDTDLVSLTIKVPNPVNNVTGVQQLSVSGIYDNGATQDLTPLASWKSSNASVLSVSSTGFAQCLAGGRAQVTSTVVDFQTVSTIECVATTLLSLSILPTSSDFALGTNRQFTALGFLSNGAQFDATQTVSWASSDPTVLTINQDGLAKSGRAGSTTVTATQQGVSATSTVVNVTSATITGLTISPVTSRIAVGTHAQFNVAAWFSDGSVQDVSNALLWTVSNPTIASADDNGTIYGITPGTVTITANAGTISVSAPLTVTNASLLSTVLTPGNVTMPVGVEKQFSLIGSFSDGTTQDMSADAIWLSPTPSVDFTTQSGAVVGLAPGVGTIGAQLGNFTASTPVTITNASLTALTLTPANTIIRQQGSQQMVATGTFSDGSQQNLYLNAVFNSANPQIASFQDASGKAFATGIGSTQITASFRNQQASTTSFVVESGVLQSIALGPTTPAAASGGTVQLTATGTYADATVSDLSRLVTWTSSSPAVLSVDANGLATAHATTTPVTVTVTGQYETFTQSYTVTILPSTESLANVTGLTVSPANPTIGTGSTRQFFATATYVDGTTGDVTGTASWIAIVPAVATVDNSGLATALSTGSTGIAATVNGIRREASVTVQDAPAPVATLLSIAVAPSTTTINVGKTTYFTAAGTWSDGTIADISSSVTWLSSNTAVATVNSAGVAAGVSAGAATISAVWNGVTGTGSLTVNPAAPAGTTVTSITVSPSSSTIAPNATQQFSAVATFSDNSTQNITTAATWTSSNSAIASVNHVGLATSLAAGSVAIAATWNGTSGSAALTVSSNYGGGNPALTAITLSPTSGSVAVGASLQYGATGTYSDGTTQNLTGSVTWASSSTSAATIAAGGLATGAATGSVTITATSGNITGVAALTVTASNATLTAVVVKPTSSQLITGLSQQLAAIGFYNDGTSRDISSTVTWSSASQLVAIVSSTGQVTGLTAGTAVISCAAGSFQSQTTILVNSATLQSLAISPSGESLPVGVVQQLILMGTYSNGSHFDLTSAATWTSGAGSVAGVSGTGLVTATAPGTAQINAAYAGQTASTAVRVTAASLVSIAVSPTSASFAKGTTQPFTVLATYSDGSTYNVTTQATYLSSNTTVVTASNGLAAGAAAGTARITVSFAGDSTTTQTITVTPATLVSIALSPNNPSFARGSTQQFAAIGTFSDGTTEDLSSEILWTSTNPQAATIDDNGLATSASPGSTQITASFHGVTATTGTVQVSNAALTGLSLSPTTAQIAKGTTQQFTATGTYSDASTQNLSTIAVWATSNTSVASISATGLATGNSVGATQITAALGGFSASTSSFQVTPATLVSIAFSPANPSVPVGTSAQVTVTGTYSDGSTQNLTSSSLFSSSNTAAVTVDSAGVLTGVAPGTSTITVTVNGQTSTFTTSTTTATLSTITITPAMPANMPKGTTQQFTATGTFSDGSTEDLTSTATWTTSNAGVLTVNSHGLATGASLGMGALTAAYQSQSATTPSIQVTAAVIASIAVTPANDSVVQGSTLQYSATATYTDATSGDVTNTATWASSSTAVATISASGSALALTAGSTTISAALSSLTGSTPLTVTAAVAPTLLALSVTPAAVTIADGGTQQFVATGTYSDGSSQNLTSSVTWTSGSTAVATIDNTGLASGVSGGTTVITATSGTTSGVAALTVSSAALVSLSVTPATASLASGTTQQYTATGTLSDGSTQNLSNSVTWTSSSSAIATINASGVATAASVGTTTITATSGSVSGTAALSVSSATVTAVVATPDAVTAPAGGTQQLTVTGVFSNASTQNVTVSAVYLSPNPNVATVNSTGLLTVTGVGTTSITVSLGGQTTTVQVIGTAATLTSIAVTPANLSSPVSQTQQMTATGTYSDGSTQNLTASALWTSSAATVASVNLTTGLVTIAQVGTATITATSGATSGSTNITGTMATVTAISVSPTPATLAVGQNQQFTATAALSDGTQQNVTTTVQWSASDATKGTISNIAGTNGLFFPTATGSLIVTATLNAIAGSAPVTITSATPTSLTVTPSPVSVPAGATQQMTVIAHYSDGSTADVTSTATWTSAGSSIATVDASGVLHGVAVGTTTVTATQGITAQSDAVTVTNATLQSIAITPALPRTPLGVSVPLTATGTYTDGSTTDLTSQVRWSSSSPAVATVSTSGVATTVSAGATDITATLGNISQQVALTVTSAVLGSISVQATQTSFARGLSLQLTAIGTYSDNSTQNLTNLVSWSSQTPSVGLVNSAGLATGVAPGTFNAKATLTGVSGTLAITVTSAVLQSIAVTPSNQLLSTILGNPVQFTAIGTFSDGSTQNMTNSVHWSITSGISLGSISSTGRFSAVGLGVCTVTATSGTITGSAGNTIVSL